MTMTLRIKGKERIFSTDFVSARMLRRTIEIAKKTNFDDISAEELDGLVQFLVELYGGQFTIDDVYDGLPSGELLPTITTSIHQVVNGLADATSTEAAQGKNVP